MQTTFRETRLLLTVLSLSANIGVQQAQAQSIVPASDGTGSIVTANGNRFDITGGQLSGDKTNRFHSFSQFGLNQGQVAHFLTDPQVRNILGRVVGGNASVIDGLIQVSGHANLFLMNPAGIVFGPNASLNVPAAFTATTATGIGFGSNWFNAAGTNNYAALGGGPTSFAFTTGQPGAIINAGSLSVPRGNLTLLGGTVAITGQLSAPNGQVTVAAVPGEKLVRISQQGMLLSLDVQPLATGSNQPNWTLPVLSLPQLLNAPGVGNATGLKVNDGHVELIGSGMRVENGDVVVDGAGVTSVPSNFVATVTAQTATLQAAKDLKLVSHNSSAADSSGSFSTSYGNQLTTSGNLKLQAQRDYNSQQDRRTTAGTGVAGGGGISAQAASVVQQRLNPPNHNSDCTPFDTIAVETFNRAPEALVQTSKTPISQPAKPCDPLTTTDRTFKIIDSKPHQRQQLKINSRLRSQRPSMPELDNMPVFSKSF